MLRYREQHRVCCDVIPYFWDGQYHLFFLNGYADDSGWSRSQTPWSHLVCQKIDQPMKLTDAIEPGVPSNMDGHACFTGSILCHEGLWHIFYTGFAPLRIDGREHILHATSVDGVHFEKDTSFKPLAPDHHYYGADEDFRDPFVFWNEQEHCFCMTVTAGAFEPISNCQRGVIGLLISDDLWHWRYAPPIYEPESYMPMECSDLFFENGVWYMLFSQYMHTEYRMADSIFGPWRRPKIPCLDGGAMAFYAAKSLYDGKRHLLYGWCGTYEGGTDRAACQWGGDIVSPRELFVGEDRELSQRFPEDLFCAYRKQTLVPHTILGEWHQDKSAFACMPKAGLSVLALDSTTQNRRVELDITTDGQAGWLYVFLCAANDLSTYYTLRIDTATREVCILRNGYRDSVYGSIMDGIRIMATHVLADMTNAYHIELLIGAQIMESITNERVALTARLQDFADGALCIGCEHVGATFHARLYEANCVVDPIN